MMSVSGRATQDTVKELQSDKIRDYEEEIFLHLYKYEMSIKGPQG
jgi:hypothetical protein